MTVDTQPRIASRRFIIAMTVCLSTCVVLQAGCRAIRRFGESRQAITGRRLSGQGFQAIHDGQWETAETLFSDALKVSRTDDRAHWGMAEAFWNRGQTDDAIRHMEQAVRLSAGDPAFVRRIGRMYLDLGRVDEAAARAQEALRAERGSAEGWALHGDCLRRIGQVDDALAAYHRALALQPDSPEVQLAAAELYLDRGRYQRALATLDRITDQYGLEASPSRCDLLRGLVMRDLGRHEDARVCFLRASHKSPEQAEPLLELAALFHRRGQTSEATESLEMARRLAPQHPRVANLSKLLGVPVWSTQPDEEHGKVARLSEAKRTTK
ncbi:MAG: tetratricopeptide repeat protein [Planctomycetota bacterium]